ncbi:MAG: hypothetical protein IPO53_10690 [Chitinophagaceae bacterium]|nr:hypothetical protein [Chitinophagaceae bacterium]
MKIFIIRIALASVIFVFGFYINANAQLKQTMSQCAKCGYLVNGISAMRSHLCSKHGIGCPTTTVPAYYNPTPAKTQQQIREEREKKELQEAAETANDEGVEYYEKKDWATAINYFKVALEYVPGFEDAIYNLKKAQEKLEAEGQRIEAERQSKEKEEEEKQKQLAEQNIQTITLPPALSKYMEEADKIIVPPPSWESNIEEQVRQIRLGQTENDKYLLIGLDKFVAAFDQMSTLNKGATYQFKLLLIGAKSTFAAQDEAEIVAFRQNAWYERTLQVLKDKKQGPLLIAAIKALRDKKPMPPGISPELEKNG